LNPQRTADDIHLKPNSELPISLSLVCAESHDGVDAFACSLVNHDALEKYDVVVPAHPGHDLSLAQQGRLPRRVGVGVAKGPEAGVVVVPLHGNVDPGRKKSCHFGM
jgi:predicted RNA binding protein YcfA (HicA-like mRNA interferase family)